MTTPAEFRLEGSIPPRRLSASYRFTVAFSAAAALVLPLAYVALIVVVAWGVWIYAFGGFVQSAFDHGIGLWGWLAAIGPVTGGSLLTLFLIKPLFARRPVQTQPLTLDLATQPRLRELIAAVCAKIGAPLPARVEVDCQANASAHLRRGLLSIGRRDYVLTLGLPLVAGLDARQFTAVLAHELGHFAQGAGMSSSHIILAINRWFARVVFERDRFDRQLDRAMESNQHGYGAAIVACAVALIWIGRKILHGLMQLGNAVTCLQLRQMERDADYYQTAISGSHSFTTTMDRVRTLQIASDSAFRGLGSLWQHGRLASDYPAYVIWHRSQPAVTHQAVKPEARPGKFASWFATHPSDADRAALASALGLPGLFRGEGPASAVFENFESICRQATRHLYRNQLNLPYDESALVAPTAVLKTAEADTASQAAFLRLAGTALDFDRPLLWSAGDFISASPPPDGPVLGQKLAELRARLDSLRPSSESAAQVCGNILKHYTEKEIALALIAAKVAFRPSAFGLSKIDRTEAENDLRELVTRLDKKAVELRPFESALHEYICLVGQAARDPAISIFFREGGALRATALTDGLSDLAPWFRKYREWSTQQRILAVFASVATEVKTGRFEAEHSRQQTHAKEMTANAPGLVGRAAHPFAETLSGGGTAAEILSRSLAETPEPTRLDTLLNTVGRYHIRLLGEISALGEQLENRLNAPSTLGGNP